MEVELEGKKLKRTYLEMSKVDLNMAEKETQTEAKKLKTNLDLIDECDNFPYHENLKEIWVQAFPGLYEKVALYKFQLPGSTKVYGYMLAETVEKMPWRGRFKIDHANMKVTPTEGFNQVTTAEMLSNTLENILNDARRQKTFEVLEGWRDELLPVVGAPGVHIERSGSALFGIVSLGVHLTAYTITDEGVKIWVPMRAETKQTYPGMLDNTVAGGISAGELPFESLVREAAEEASLPEDIVRQGAKACGMVSYFHIRDKRAGGEKNLMQPEIQYVYDLELPAEVEPTPADDEVQEFYLLGIEEVRMALAEGRFKPNCAVVLLDFFVRHGVLTAENEEDYVEICARMHRKLPFAPFQMPK